jgi:hypothetical protein
MASGAVLFLSPRFGKLVSLTLNQLRDAAMIDDMIYIILEEQL